MLIRALLQTSPLWEPIRLVYSWVHRAAHVLSNEEALRVEQLRRDYRHLLAEMSRRKEQAGDLSGAVSLFLKVTKSYWKGLFRCYSFPEGTLPRTNNDLEHYCGSVRYGERRASGRKGASPAMVLRGSVRAIAAIATPQEGFAAADIRPTNVEGWRSLRASLEKRRESRRAQLRFRPSYASGGTQMPISAGSKSSYSSRLCRPSFFEGLLLFLVGFLVARTTGLELDLASPEELADAFGVRILDAVALSKELVGLRDGGDLPTLHGLLKLLEGFGRDQLLTASLADPAL